MMGFIATNLYCLQSCVTFLALFRSAVSMTQTKTTDRWIHCQAPSHQSWSACMLKIGRGGGGEGGGAQGSLKEPLQLTADIAPPGM